MTVGELKAFIDGMDVKKSPTPEQWARIVERLDKLTGPQPAGYLRTSTTYPYVKFPCTIGTPVSPVTTT